MKRAIAFFVSIVILMVTNTVLASDGANIDCVKEISAFPVGASTRMTTYGGEGKLLYNASQDGLQLNLMHGHGRMQPICMLR